MGYNLSQSLFILLAGFPRFGLWTPLQVGFYIFLEYAPRFLSTSIFSGTTRYFRLIWYFPCPSPATISSRTQFSLIRTWYLETKIWAVGGFIGAGVSQSLTSTPENCQSHVTHKKKMKTCSILKETH